jgi:hypothetical protein
MTARPLADCTLAPVMPAPASSSASTQKPCTAAAPISAAPHTPRPVTSTARSPSRSVARPHGIRLTTEPTSDAEISSPVRPSERWNSSRSDGAITATPYQIAE